MFAFEPAELSEAEATQLSYELKEKLIEGKISKEYRSQIDRLVAGLSDYRGLIRRTFAESLGEIGSETLPALTNTLLHNPNVTARRAAAKTLKLVGDSKALPDLLSALLNDSDPVVQGSSVAAMAIFGEEAVEILLEVIINPNTSSLQSGLASWGLAFIGAEAPDSLRKAAQSKNELIRAASISALMEQINTLEEKKDINLVFHALNDSSEEVRIEATKMLGELDQKFFPNAILINKLQDESPEVRKNAAICLIRRDAVEAKNELIKTLSNEKNKDTYALIKLAIKKLSN